jgi:hypothetical protein
MEHCEQNLNGTEWQSLTYKNLTVAECYTPRTQYMQHM